MPPCRLRLRGERGEEDEGKPRWQRSSRNHAATVACWLSTAAVFRQASIFHNLIWPLDKRLKSKTRF
jgi:hypothetical protein